ncbi:MAG: hypothetical protein MJZ00_01940 [Paludibacteraceae bacterium]|nr:hypothetical protein [Paludibacteraceae bacterium]
MSRIKHIIVTNIIICFALISCNQKAVENEESQQNTDYPSDYDSVAVAFPSEYYDEEYEEEEIINNELCEYGHVFNKEGRNTKEIIPEQWEIKNEATGDLNKDGIADLVFNARKIGTTEYEYYSVNENPQIFAIYWGNGDGTFTQYKAWKGLIEIDKMGVWNHANLEITEKGVLKVLCDQLSDGGGWGSTAYTTKYRFQDNKFYKIGYDQISINKSDGYTVETSINYLTGKKCIKEYNMFEYDGTNTTWESFEEPLQELGSEMF